VKFFVLKITMSLFIARLHPDTHNKDLEDLFREFGSITRCEVKRGFGFVEFKDKRDAEESMKELQGASLLGNRIVIEWARGGRGDFTTTLLAFHTECFLFCFAIGMGTSCLK